MKTIEFNNNNKHLYKGCGWVLASLIEGKPTALYYLNSDLGLPSDNPQKDADLILQYCIEWIKSTRGQVVLAMASSYQLCDPAPINKNDANSLAKLARVAGEVAIDD